LKGGIIDAPMRFKVVKDVAFSISHPLSVEDLDEIHGIKSKLPHFLSSYVSPLHVIFDLNGSYGYTL
jgi:hypothetical protein